MANREIKFRAWNHVNCVMLEARTIQQLLTEYPLSSDDVDELIIQQYTGLKDSNGVEIYEGDIVEYFSDFTEEKSNHQVKYFCNDDYPAFDFRPSISDDMNGFSALAYQEIGTVKVIGNIYQNPELLK